MWFSEIPASPEEKPGKENTGSDAGKVADTARDERSTPSMKTVAEDMAGGKEKTSGDGKTLPLFLQPGDDRKR